MLSLIQQTPFGSLWAITRLLLVKLLAIREEFRFYLLMKILLQILLISTDMLPPSLLLLIIMFGV